MFDAVRLFNRLEAAISHHKKAHDSGRYFADDPDEALWAARDKILRDVGDTSEKERVEDQAALCNELEKALKSRRRFTVQAMPNGCEIIDCDSGELLKTIQLIEVPNA